MTRIGKAVRGVLATAAFALFAGSAAAVPVSVNQWYEFGFGDAGSALSTGVGFVPGLVSVQVGDAPWTFNCSSACTLFVTDGFINVDQFELFDNLASLGLTSAPAGTGQHTCNNDELACLTDPAMSHGIFALAAGNHSITGTHTIGIPGAGFFFVGQQTVPEPSTLLLLAVGLAGFVAVRRRA